MIGWTVKLDPVAVAHNRAEFDLNSGSLLVDQAGIDWGDAAITTYMANEQQWGAHPVSYRVPNRTVTIPLLLSDDTLEVEEEVKRSGLQQKAGLLQREGGWLLRQRQDGLAMYADVVSATLTLPDVWGETGGVEPNVKLILECLPDFYGDVIPLDPVSGTGEIAAVLSSGGVPALIAGDHPGRAQIMITDASGADKHGLLWGFRSRYYDPGTALAYAAAQSLAAAVGSGITTLAGARYDVAITRAAVPDTWTDLAFITASHIGSYRVWARVYSVDADGLSYRFAWNIGDANHGLIENAAAAVPAGGDGQFWMRDLGQLRLDPVPYGNQQFVGVVQVLASEEPCDASIDMLYFQPLDDGAARLIGDVPNNNPVMLAGSQLQLRWDATTRAIPGGQVFAPTAPPIGDLPRIPPSGQEGRPVELLIKPSRGDLRAYADAGSDPFKANVSYRPCYLGRP